jgi:hypothetical protein
MVPPVIQVGPAASATVSYLCACVRTAGSSAWGRPTALTSLFRGSSVPNQAQDWLSYWNLASSETFRLGPLHGFSVSDGMSASLEAQPPAAGVLNDPWARFRHSGMRGATAIPRILAVAPEYQYHKGENDLFPARPACIIVTSIWGPYWA